MPSFLTKTAGNLGGGGGIEGGSRGTHVRKMEKVNQSFELGDVVRVRVPKHLRYALQDATSLPKDKEPFHSTLEA